MGDEVLEFAKGIGATDLKSVFDNSEFHGLFKRRNYFLLKPDTYLIVKVSRNEIKGFWGLGKKFVELFNMLTESSGRYFFVALETNKSGWILSKKELLSKIADRSLSYSDQNEQYKINRHNLRFENGFESMQGFLRKIG
jgi:hypothetical protein